MLKTAARVARKYSGEALRRTALYDFHVACGGKMVPFAGWEMAVLYGDVSLVDSHKWCRENASLFDVSHMGQLHIYGADRFDFIESLIPGNIKDLKAGKARLTQFTNEEGGILDDTMITKRDEHIYQVVNAACVEQDLALMGEALSNFDGDAEVVHITDRMLLALQGPKAVDVLQQLTDYDLSEQPFMSQIDINVAGFDCWVSRCGYTGEDGFEISVPAEQSSAFAEILVEFPEVECAGLAPRDSLRLECGLCLMGSDMLPTTTPIEANLRWTIGKRRREEANFPGAEKILDQWENGCDILRVGFRMNSKRVARAHYTVHNLDGDEIGEVTSGTLGPNLGYPVGMCYVPTEYADIGTELLFNIRGKLEPGEICEMPFVDTSFYRGGAW